MQEGRAGPDRSSGANMVQLILRVDQQHQLLHQARGCMLSLCRLSGTTGNTGCSQCLRYTETEHCTLWVIYYPCRNGGFLTASANALSPGLTLLKARSAVHNRQWFLCTASVDMRVQELSRGMLSLWNACNGPPSTSCCIAHTCLTMIQHTEMGMYKHCMMHLQYCAVGLSCVATQDCSVIAL